MDKRNNLGVIVAASTLSMLFGCNDKVQTIDWYKTHEKERKEMLEKCNERLKKCKTNPVEILTDPNCLNAQKAATSEDVKEKNAPKIKPMIWDPKKGLVSQN